MLHKILHSSKMCHSVFIMKVFTLKALARLEGVTYDHLRFVMRSIQDGSRTAWRGYRFFGIEGKAWFAYKGKEAIQVIRE